MSSIKSPVILIDENVPFLAEMLTETASVHSFHGRMLKASDISKLNTDAIVVRSTTKVNAGLVAGTNVRFIGSATSGVDHIDSTYLSDNGIYFCHAAGANANSVAEYVLFAILKWANLSGVELNGAIIGIVGFGHIGKIVAQYSGLLGLKVVVNDPPLRDSGYIFPEWLEYWNLKDLCNDCDIITNHVPLTHDGKYRTVNLFGESIINSIKNGALFIHASRGGVAAESELSRLIKQGLLFGAIDVWENEPSINIDNAENCLIATPHIAGYSIDGKIRGVEMIALEIERFFGTTLNYNPIKLSRPNPSDSTKLFSNLEDLYNKIKAARCFDQDTLEFQSIADLNLSLRANAFDKLRKGYPERYETLSYIPNLF